MSSSRFPFVPVVFQWFYCTYSGFIQWNYYYYDGDGNNDIAMLNLWFLNTNRRFITNPRTMNDNILKSNMLQYVLVTVK